MFMSEDIVIFNENEILKYLICEANPLIQRHMIEILIKMFSKLQIHYCFRQ